MSLVLSLHSGDDFFVDGQRVVVENAVAANDFELVVEATAERFKIDDKVAKEILPEVFVSAGEYFQFGYIRAVIDAPRSILILRGDKYRSDPTAYAQRVTA